MPHVERIQFSWLELLFHYKLPAFSLLFLSLKPWITQLLLQYQDSCFCEHLHDQAISQLVYFKSQIASSPSSYSGGRNVDAESKETLASCYYKLVYIIRRKHQNINFQKKVAKKKKNDEIIRKKNINKDWGIHMRNETVAPSEKSGIIKICMEIRTSHLTSELPKVRIDSFSLNSGISVR